MKKTFITTLTCLAAFTLFVGCQKKDKVVEVEEAPVSEQASVAETTAPPAGAVMIRGTVLETMATAGYTYVHVDDGTQQVWAAAPSFSVSEGDTVNVPPGQAMPEYHSKSLDRTFDVVYFVPSITVGDAADPAAAMPAGHPAPTADATDISLEGIAKAEGGLTIEELFRDRDSLAGKEVAIRGKVVKFSPQIMGTNWLHLQDGTSHEGANDLTITSGSEAAKGDTVLVTGAVTLDKDFGAGYRYDLIIEDANVSVE